MIKLLLVLVLASGSFCLSEWDHFVFSQQWPQSVCYYRNLTKQFNCEIPKDTKFWTVHGLWPSLNTSMGPSFCNKSSKFDPKQVDKIKDKLGIFWPNLFTDEDANSFWKHEWEKHGTCALSMTVLNTELKYFTKGLELHNTFDFSVKLQKKGIVPSDDVSYLYYAFYKAVKEILGFDAKVQCFYDKEKKKQLIAEIEFCLSPSFVTIKCPIKKTETFNDLSPGNCKNDNLLLSLRDRSQDGVFKMTQKEKIILKKKGVILPPKIDMTSQGNSPVPCNPELEIFYPVIR